MYHASRLGEDLSALFSKPKRLYLDYRSLVHSITLVSSSTQWRSGELKVLHFRKFLQPCVSLTHIHADIPVLNDDDLWVIASACKNLQSVYLTSGSHSGGRITDEGLVALAQQSKRLSRIHLRAFSHNVLTDRGIAALAESFKDRLVSFGLELSISSLGGSYDGPLISPTFQKFGDATYYDRPDCRKKFTDALISLIISNPLLESLHLDWPCGVEETLVSAVGTLKRLKTIKAGNVHDQGLVQLIKDNLFLSEIALYDINLQGSSLKSMFEPLTHSTCLKKLELIGIGFLAELVPIASQFTSLVSLKLSPSSRAASLQNMVAEDLICQLVRSCPNLQVFHVPIVTDGPLIALSACQSIQDVDIIDGRHLSNQALVCFTTSAKNLTKLSLGSAKDIGDQAILLLAKSCRQLILLTLPFGATGITFKSLEAISDNCSKLVGLANIPHTIGVDELVQSLCKLRKLLLISICCVGEYGPLAGRFVMSREDQDRIKGACKKLRHVVLNG